MIVVIDMGNTRINWARVQDRKLVDAGHALHIDTLETAFEALGRALTGHAERVMVTNVAGEVLAARLVTFALEHWSCEPEFVEPAAQQYGVRCAYADPARLGADRWVAVIAAHQAAPGPACVIDAGTSTTFDAVDGDGRHLGGLILPGHRMMAFSLHAETSDIGLTDGPAGSPEGMTLLGRSTDEAVGRGAMLALAAGFDRAVGRVARELKADPKVFLTGGDAGLLLPWLETDVEYRADLILEGLAFIASES